MDPIELLKVDRTAFKVAYLSDETDEKEYWLSKTPQERVEAIEVMRQIVYSYDPFTERLQRVLEVTQTGTTNNRAAGRRKDLNDLENLP